MRVRSRLVGEKDWAAGAEFAVGIVDVFLIGGREIVAHGKAVRRERNFEGGVAVIAASGCGGEFPVAGDEVDVATAVGSGPGVGLPDAAFLRARRDIEDAGLLQRSRVVRHDPADAGPAADGSGNVY